VISADNNAVLRQIKTERSVGDKWLVTGGLAAGERVITEGLIRITPGQLVRPVPAGSAARLAKPGAQRK
jgi:membrane fusion protein (multidrug efflux system)